MKLFYILAIILFLSGCSNPDIKNDEQQSEKKESARSENTITFTPEQVQEAGIITGPFQAKLVSEKLYCTGEVMVHPDNMVAITPFIGGIIKNLYVVSGKYVKQGELLATIQHQDYINLQREFIETKSQLAFIEKEYQRQKNLVEENASALKSLEKTESELNSLKVNFIALKAQLKMAGINPDKISESEIQNEILIKAPINGYITEVNATTGQYVSSTEILFQIINNSNQHLELKVFEKDVLKIGKGQEVKFSIENQNEQNYEAVIVFVGQNIDPVSRTVEVHCHLKEQYLFLKYGMRVFANILIDSKSGNVVPEEAVIRNGDQLFIFVESSTNQFMKIPIIEQFADEEHISLTTDFSSEEEKNLIIVMKGANYIEAELQNEE